MGFCGSRETCKSFSLFLRLGLMGWGFFVSGLLNLNDPVIFPDDMPSQACQSPEVHLHYCRYPRDFSKMLPGSASMPSFAITADIRRSLIEQEGEELPAEEQMRLDETAHWLRKSKTQNFEQADGGEGVGVFGDRTFDHGLAF
jgi:hypothetical protein